MKLQNVYDLMNDSSSEESSGGEGETDSEDAEEDTVLEIEDLKLSGYRLIDVALLTQNIASSLVCTFCHGAVQLIEVSRKGLGSHMAFHCQNKVQ